MHQLAQLEQQENPRKPQISRFKSKKEKIVFSLIIFLCLTLLVAYIIKVNQYHRNVLFYPDLHLPIHFSWLGSRPLPQKYAKRLKKLNFPYKLLGEQDYAEFKDFFNFDQNISVSKRNDAFRLRYMWKYGGIYADLDYIIDYQCLMMKFQGLQGTYYIMQQDRHREPISSLFYASKPGDPILDQVTSIAHSRQNQTTLSFVVSYLIHTYGDRLNAIDLDMCVYHQFDGSWVKDDPNPW